MDWGTSGSETERMPCRRLVWLQLWDVGLSAAGWVEVVRHGGVAHRLLRQMANLADQVDGAGGDDEAVGWGDGAGLGEGCGEVGGGLGGDVEGVGGGEEVFEAGGAGVVDGGEEDVVVAARVAGLESKRGKRIWAISREVLVAEAGEEEGAGLGLGELGDGGAESPGAGGVVGYVEEEVGASGRGGVRGGRASWCCGCLLRWPIWLFCNCFGYVLVILSDL